MDLGVPKCRKPKQGIGQCILLDDFLHFCPSSQVKIGIIANLSKRAFGFGMTHFLVLPGLKVMDDLVRDPKIEPIESTRASCRCTYDHP